jgi:biotin synthase
MTRFQDIIQLLLEGSAPSPQESSLLENARGDDLFQLLATANRIREGHFGNRVRLCSIVNAKSGRCPENCAFCAQSVHHDTDAPVYPLLDPVEIAATALKAGETGSSCFGIVTSGSSITKGPELERICAALRTIRSR